MPSREHHSGLMRPRSQTTHGCRQDERPSSSHPNSMGWPQWLWAVSLAALIGPTPAQAASGQAGFVCTQAAATLKDGSTTPVDQAWADALMVFDFDRKLVFHGDGSERYPIRKITDRVITWQSETGALKGFFSRATLEAGEVYRQDGLLTQRTYACRANFYLSFAAKP
jgi:hypothetical protein